MQNWLELSHKGPLRKTAISGAFASLGGQGGRMLVQFASLAALARLLAPADFGLIAMTATITGLVGVFADGGLSMATIQRQDITHAHVSTLFWVNVGIGFVLWIVLLALSPLIAWFYGEPRLVLLTIVVALTFPIRGLAVQHEALLKRNLKLWRLNLTGLASAAIGSGVAIIGAYRGLGFWSLAIQLVCTAILTTLGAWLTCNWKPTRTFRLHEVRAMLRFGSALTGGSLLVYLFRNFDNILIGRYWGKEPLGLYTRAYSLLLLPMRQITTPITSVMVPLLSRVQAEPARYVRMYRLALLTATTLSMPISVLMLVVADDLIFALLGPKWTESVPIFRALGPAAIISTFTMSIGWVYLSMGHARRQLVWNLIAIPIYLASYAIALPFGTRAVAWSLSLSLSLMILPTIYYAYKETPLRLRDFFVSIWRPSAASLGAALLLWTGLEAIGNGLENLVIRLAAETLLFGICYAGAWYLLPGGRSALRDLLGLASLRSAQKNETTS